MCDSVEVQAWIHERQGCLGACVQTEPSTEKVFQKHQMQPDVVVESRTHRTQSPHYESQDATQAYLTQDGFFLMRPSSGQTASDIPVVVCHVFKAQFGDGY